jgi:formylglycine-generating enzyme required for sulfatase activity
LQLIRIYRVPILILLVTFAIIVPLLVRLSNLIPQITSTFNNATPTTTINLYLTSQQNLTSTETLIPTEIFTPSLTPTENATPTATSLPTEITDAKGMQMVLVSAGEFTMGSDDDTGGGYGSKPAHTVYLDSFYIDKYEVSNAIYKICVNAGSCLPPVNPSSFTYYGYYGDAKYANFQVVNVSWDNASAYCKWTSGRLPSEAEWEKAARGTDERLYPWGNSFDSTKANINTDNFHFYLQPIDSNSDGKSVYNAFNMLGNAAEWVNDWYAYDYYLNSPLKNPMGPDSGTERVIRSNISHGSSDMKVFSRFAYYPAGYFSYNQYLRQLWAGGRLKNWVNSTQTGDLLKDLSQ